MILQLKKLVKYENHADNETVIVSQIELRADRFEMAMLFEDNLHLKRIVESLNTGNKIEESIEIPDEVWKDAIDYALENYVMKRL